MFLVDHEGWVIGHASTCGLIKRVSLITCIYNLNSYPN